MKQDAYAVGLFDEEYNGYWGYEETDFIIKLYYNGVTLENLSTRKKGMAICYHQPHKVNRKWQERSAKRNRRILRNKLPKYKLRQFPEAMH